VPAEPLSGGRRDCPSCRASIPDGMLACPDCAERQSRLASLEEQKRYLAEVLRGDRLLTLTKTANQTRWHVLLLGEPGHVWCGQRVTGQWMQRRVVYPEQQLANVCRQCREVFDRLVKEVA